MRSVYDYAFAVGKIRALEKFLLKQEVFEEAIESGILEALKIFAETVYSDEILHVKDSRQLEAILDEETRLLKNAVGKLILDKELLFLLEITDIRDAFRLGGIYASRFLNDYLMHLVDMHNIKSFLRLYILKEPLEKLGPLITCEGFLKKKDFLALYPQDIAAFLKKLEYVHKHNNVADYSVVLGDALQKTIEQKSFLYLEKAINDFLMQALRPAKYIVFGPEPVLAFYFAKLNEINLMRMIILAKLNNLPDDLAKERLNSVYA